MPVLHATRCNIYSTNPKEEEATLVPCRWSLVEPRKATIVSQSHSMIWFNFNYIFTNVSLLDGGCEGATPATIIDHPLENPDGERRISWDN